MGEYIVVAILTFVMTLSSVGVGYVMGKSWLDKRLNKPTVKP